VARLAVDGLVEDAETATIKLRGVRDDAQTLQLYAHQLGRKDIANELEQVILTLHIAQAETGAAWARLKRMTKEASK
jgi:hypothetical protein